MAVTEHTPGPWTWWTSNSWRRLKNDERGKSHNVLEPFVARDGHPDLLVSVEDMKLIAAAPDLLVALENLTDNIEMAFPSLSSLGPLVAARAAIAKAKGQSL